MAEFKQLVLRLRKLRGWSQEKMARAIDLSREQVSRLESGSNKPQPRTVERLAEVFGLPVERLKAPILSEQKIDDLLAVAKLHFESQAAGAGPKGLEQFGQFVLWFRSMSESDQSLTLAALQKINEENLKSRTGKK